MQLTTYLLTFLLKEKKKMYVILYKTPNKSHTQIIQPPDFLLFISLKKMILHLHVRGGTCMT